MLAVLLAACNQSARPTATATAGGLSCRLPVSISDPKGGSSTGAFVSFPSGQVTVDPSGTGRTFYDRPLSRWLPASPNAVSADGTSYAYVDFKVPGTAQQQHLHLIDLSSGRERVFLLAHADDPSAYTIVDYAPEGIWLTFSGYEGPSGGLFFLDLTTGVFKDAGILDLTAPIAGSQGVFWFTDPGPNPQMGGGIGYVIQSRVLRLTVSDRKREVWLSMPGYEVTVLGTDLAGHPIVRSWLDGGADEAIRLVLSPTKSKVIGVPQGNYQVMADSHGLWFGGNQGLYHYSEAGGVKKVSSQLAYPAGACA